MRLFTDNRPQRASLSAPAGEEMCAITISLSEPSSSDHVWEVRLEAKGGNQAASRELGRILTRSPVAGAPPSRVLALACSPGASEWTVEVLHVSGTTPEQAEAELEITGCPFIFDEGIRIINGHDSSEGQRYWLQSGALAAGPNPVNVPAGVAIHAIHAWLDAPDTALIQYLDPETGALITAPIPSGSGITLGPRGTLWGPITIGFTLLAETGGFAIEGLS